MTDRDSTREDRAADLFDLRRVIGGLFALYGIVLTIVGITDGSDEIELAAGLRINLLAGLGMLALAAGFLLWARLRPLSRELRDRSGSESPPPT